MKVCHISTGFPLSYQGGITNYVRSLAQSQSDEGNEVWVLCGQDGNEYSYHRYNYLSNKIEPLKLRKMEDKDALNEVRIFFEEHQFDIIHIHMMLDMDWNLYEIIKPYKYIVSLHDYFFLCPRIQMLKHNNELCTRYEREKCEKCISWFNTVRLFNGIEYRINNKLGWKKFRFPEIKQHMTDIRYNKFKMLLENAEMLLPVSNRVEEIFKDSGIQGKYKVMHIGNITADTFVPSFSFDTTKQKFDIVMLGSLSYLKGGDLLLKLAKLLNRNKFNFHFYGRSNSYKKYIDECGIIDHGPYEQKQLSKILENMDFGLVLSVWEDNGPQVVMEMLNNHVPVIGTRLGGIPDFVDDNHNGILFNPFSEKEFDDLVNRLNSLSADDVFRMKQNIKPTTTTKEHFEDMKKVYMDVLK